MNPNPRNHGLLDPADARAEGQNPLCGDEVAVSVRLGEDETISRFITYGAAPETIQAIGHFPRGEGLLGLLIRDPRIIRLADLHAHPASVGFPEHHPPMGNFLGAPVRMGTRVYGNLYLTEKRDASEFSEADERAVVTLAAQVRSATENVGLSLLRLVGVIAAAVIDPKEAAAVFALSPGTWLGHPGRRPEQITTSLTTSGDDTSPQTFLGCGHPSAPAVGPEQGRNMTVKPATLTRVAALSAAAAGLLFIIAQPMHPPDDVAHVATTMWPVVHTMTLTMSILGLVGLTGLYLRQVREVGVLGLIGYVLFALFYAFAIGFQFFEAFILPSVVTEAPRLAESFLGIISGTGGPIELPALQVGWLVVSVAYLAGGLLLGIAFARAAVLARGAGVLLAAGTAASLLTMVLPHGFARYAAVPVGVALIWLGASLWSDQRRTVMSSPAEHRSTALGVSG
jgi:hypothetical protein